MGVPKAAKLQAELMVELTCLHTLYVAGKFDWRHRINSLSWMNTMRDRLANSAVSASVAQSLVLAALDEAGWDTSSQGDFECMAGDSGLVAPPHRETPGMLGWWLPRLHSLRCQRG